VEAPSASDASYLKKIEKKKLLSGVESLGLLSKAEKAGLTLSTVRWVQPLPTMLACLRATFSSFLPDSRRISPLTLSFRTSPFLPWDVNMFGQLHAGVTT
jgi:hypothetical protein